MTDPPDDRLPTDYTDALILYVLCGPRRGMSLADAVGVMDGINRDYPTVAQWNHAIKRHASAGLLTTFGGRFTITAQGRRLVKTTRVGPWLRPETHGSVQRLARALPATSDRDEITQPLTAAEFDAAIAEYLSRHDLASRLPAVEVHGKGRRGMRKTFLMLAGLWVAVFVATFSYMAATFERPDYVRVEGYGTVPVEVAQRLKKAGCLRDAVYCDIAWSKSCEDRWCLLAPAAWYGAIAVGVALLGLGFRRAWHAWRRARRT